MGSIEKTATAQTVGPGDKGGRTFLAASSRPTCPFPAASPFRAGRLGYDMRAQLALLADPRARAQAVRYMLLSHRTVEPASGRTLKAAQECAATDSTQPALG